MDPRPLPSTFPPTPPVQEDSLAYARQLEFWLQAVSNYRERALPRWQAEMNGWLSRQLAA